MPLFLIFVLGLCLGSFLNVVIYRLKSQEPILFSRSHCPKCQHVLTWFDLIPLLSFVLPKGKCRYCGQRISWQYPLVELSTGLAFVLVFNSQASFFDLIYYWLMSCFLIVIFVYDLKHYLIPDKIIYLAIIMALLFSIYFSLSSGYSLLLNRLLAAFLAGSFFWGLVIVSQGRWMGLGDVKLVFLMGLVLGWPSILLALFLAFFWGALIGITLILAHKKKMKSEIPFGPFLSSATVLTMFYGQKIIDWYLKLVF